MNTEIEPAGTAVLRLEQAHDVLDQLRSMAENDHEFFLAHLLRMASVEAASRLRTSSVDPHRPRGGSN